MLRPFAHLLHVVAGYWELLSQSLKLVFANGRNIVGQQLPTLLDVTCCVRLHTRCMLLRVVGSCSAKFETGFCKQMQHCRPTTCSN